MWIEGYSLLRFLREKIRSEEERANRRDKEREKRTKVEWRGIKL
jgi:hypothetical protein